MAFEFAHPLKARTYRIAGRDIRLELPGDPDWLLNESIANDSDVDPYWGVLWDAAIDTSRHVLECNWRRPLKTLELGCGVGLVGIAGLLAGLDVVFSDIVPYAVKLAQHNAGLNGYDNVGGRTVEWSSPPREQFELLLASDVLYDLGNHEPLLRLAGRMLVPDGRFVIGDPGRWAARKFAGLAADRAWDCQVVNQPRRRAPQHENGEFQVFELRRSGY